MGRREDYAIAGQQNATRDRVRVISVPPGAYTTLIIAGFRPKKRLKRA